MAKKIVIALLLVFVLIQFFHPEKNTANGPQTKAINALYPMDPAVMVILNKACMDCHSNNTRYPWYNNIQPMAWWMRSHISNGKRHLNFDEFAGYTLKKQDHKLEELIESQQEGWMPISSYTFIHKDAVLNDAEKKTLINWAIATRQLIKKNGNKKAVGTDS